MESILHSEMVRTGSILNMKSRSHNSVHLPLQRCIAGEELRNFSDSDLLAIILGTGTREQGVLDLASETINRFGGITGIHDAGIRELATKKGIGIRRAIRIQAALELGKRIIALPESKITIDSPKRVWNFLLPDIIGLKQEEFTVLILNNKNHLIKRKTVSLGTISEAIVHPREIFRDAIRESGSSIVIAHNHPSGVLTPSREDIETTRRIAEAGTIIGIELLDHVIMSTCSFLSLKEAGYM